MLPPQSNQLLQEGEIPESLMVVVMVGRIVF